MLKEKVLWALYVKLPDGTLNRYGFKTFKTKQEGRAYKNKRIREKERFDNHRYVVAKFPLPIPLSC